MGLSFSQQTNSDSLSDVFSPLFGKGTINILICGEWGSGKKTILRKLGVGEIQDTIVAIGMNIQTVQFKNIVLRSWQCGGDSGILRGFRKLFLEEPTRRPQAVVFVVDSSTFRFDLEQDLLEHFKFVLNGIPPGIPIAVFANKQDSFQASSEEEITDLLGLNNLKTIKTRRWHMQPTCGANGYGLKEGFKWLVDNMSNNSNTNEEVKREGNVRELILSMKNDSTRTILPLSWKEIRHATEISEVLMVNTTLTELYLGGNDIGSEGAVKISESLKKNNSLTKLDLLKNNIGSVGACAIGEALAFNSSLRELYLTQNNIDSRGVSKICESLKTNDTLTTLNLSENPVGTQGTKAIGEVLKINSTLIRLDLWTVNGIFDSSIVDGVEFIFGALKENCTLEALDFSYNWRWDKIGNDASKIIAESLKVNTTLTSLNLTLNVFGSESFKAMSEALKINSSLTELNLGSTIMSSDGGKAIREALERNTTLTEIGTTLCD